MKRLPLVAVIVAIFALTAVAQRATMHGSSGSHGGFSGSHGGFSSHGAPAFHGAPRPSAPGRFAGPPRHISGPSPYQGQGFRPVGSGHAGAPNTGWTHPRAPYHSPNAGDHRGRDRDGRGRHDRDRFFNFYALSPLWSTWGYPYLPDYWGDSDNYGSQGDSNYAAAQPDYSAGPNDAAQEDEGGDPGPAPSYTPWPYGSQRAPYSGQPSSASVAEAPVTLVFKDGRPPQQIRNYMVTATTLSVLDQQYRAIPVDQIDLAATAKANRDAGVDFSLPSGGSR